MNKFTLRFHNPQLEKLYKEEQLSIMKNQFWLNQFMYCLGVALYIFHGLIISEGARYIVFHVLMLAVGIINFSVAKKQAKAIPVLN